MNQNRMYNEFAHLWPLISDPKDYALEASFWIEALRNELGPGRHEILELGVGGGNNLSHLTGEFQSTAVDLSKGMLEVSKRLNPGVEHHVGDMRTVRLGRKFRAVIIHDAISYMLNEDDLRAAFTTAWEHLETGGVFITAPDWFKETFPGITISNNAHGDDNIHVSYAEYVHDPDPNDTMIESVFVYFINQAGKLSVEEDKHVTGLFPQATWLQLLDDVGFNTKKVPYPVHDDEREAFLLLGRKP